ncbi:hypothetical protein GOP47_0011358 [Adiantum capillus-veneris]|uniref:WRC domain-containing protein n=1 Tax=Adiantum capillus-veneris TaxID=13818 RepID=A0A9D4ZHK1_ADICA|nr:hypothetical protein GOP47_0011358 [Adiantum capillus-veneris]
MDSIDVYSSVKPPPSTAPFAAIGCPEGLFSSSLCSTDYLRGDYCCFNDSEDLDLLDSISFEDRSALLPIIHIAFPFLHPLLLNSPFCVTSEDMKLPLKACHSVPMDDLDTRTTLNVPLLRSSHASIGTSQLAVAGVLMHKRETLSNSHVDFAQGLVKELNNRMDIPKNMSMDQPVNLPLCRLTLQNCDGHILDEDQIGFKDDTSSVSLSAKVSSVSASAPHFEHLGSTTIMSNRPMASNYGFMCNKKTTGNAGVLITSTNAEAETGMLINTSSKCPDVNEDPYFSGPSTCADQLKGTMLQQDNCSSMIEVANSELMCLRTSRERKTPLCMDDENSLRAGGPFKENSLKASQDYCLTTAEGCCSTTEGLGGCHPGNLWTRVLEASVKENVPRHVSNLEPITAMLIDDKFLHAAAESTIGIPHSCLPSLTCASSDTSGIAGQPYETDDSLNDVSFDGLCVAGRTPSQNEDFLCMSSNQNMSILDFLQPSQVEPFTGESDELTALHLNGSPYLNENDMLLSLKGAAKAGIDGCEPEICQGKTHFEDDANCDRWTAVSRAVDLANMLEENQHVAPTADYSKQNVASSVVHGGKKSLPDSAVCRVVEGHNEADTSLLTAPCFKRKKRTASKKLVFKRQKLMGKDMLAYAKQAQTASPLNAALLHIVLQGGSQGVTIREALDLLGKQGHAKLLDSKQSPEFQVKEILTSCAYIKEVGSCHFVWGSYEAYDKQKTQDSSDSCQRGTNLEALRSFCLDNAKENPLGHSEELISLDENCGCSKEEEKDKQFPLKACQSSQTPGLQTTGSYRPFNVKQPRTAYNFTRSLSSVLPAHISALPKADVGRKFCILDDTTLLNASIDESNLGQCPVNVGSSCCAKQSLLGSAYSCEDNTGWCKKEIRKACRRTKFLTMPKHKQERSVFDLGRYKEHASDRVSTKVDRGQESVAGQTVQSSTNACSKQVNAEDLDCLTARNGCKGQQKGVIGEKKLEVHGEPSPLGTSLNAASLEPRGRVKFSEPGSKKVWQSVSLRSHFSGTKTSNKTKKLSHMQNIVMPSIVEHGLKESLDLERKGMPTLVKSDDVMGSRQQKCDMQTSPRKRFDVSLVKGFSVKRKRSSSKRRGLENLTKSYLEIFQVVPVDVEVEATRRCNKTDGRYWRCAQHAVPGLKYCKHHLSKTCTRKKLKKSRRCLV